MTVEIHADVPGGTMFVSAFGTEGAPDLIFLHAAGMCGSVYADMLAPLGDRFRLWTADLRGHGRTTLPADPATPVVDWTLYAADVGLLIDRLRATAAISGPLTLVGHSLGGTAALLLSAARPDIAESVIALDPANVDFAGQRQGETIENPLAERSARRRASFASRAEAMDSWRGRGVFAGWPEAALAAYVADGLKDAGDGGVRLSCDPAWEAATYRGVRHDLRPTLAAIPFPAHLVIAGMSDMFRPADRERAVHDFPGIACVEPDAGHFFPVTDPALARLHIVQGARAAI